MTQPLASWNDTPTRAAIVDFVERTTAQGGPDFVEEIDRVAVFDNDGTLWTEQPFYSQFLFAIDRLREMAPDHPEWTDQEPYASVLRGDMEAFAAFGEKGLLQVIAVTHAGMTVDAFNAIVREWIATAEHPRVKRRYPETAFAPMLELLDYLRDHGYRTHIVSGGGIDFMRAFVPDAYGIPADQIVGTSIKTEFQLTDDGADLMRLPEIDFIDDGPGKPVGIGRFIGQRPVIAVGNSDGDLQMLQYTAGGDGPRLMVILRHDDAERETAYDRGSTVGGLDKALDEAGARGWTVISMKNDFKTVFAS